jgi:hypothetical protein
MIFTFRDFIESNVVIDYFLDSHYWSHFFYEN